MGWGGQEHRVLAELEGFQRRGSTVYLLCRKGSGISVQARQRGVTVHELASAKWQFPLECLRMARWLRRERIQVLNTHSSRDGWILGIAGRLARVPVLIRSRHIDVEYPNVWMSRVVYERLADHVLTTSNRITQHLQERLGLSSGHFTTLATGIDLSRFHPGVEPAPEIRGRDSVPVVGMISVLRSWKGHRTFLESIQKLRGEGFQVKGVIVGEGPIRRWIETWIQELGLEQDVSLLGHRVDVERVLRSLDCLVIPSTAHEGIPQIGLQALASQIPVVGSDVGGIPEIIQPGHTGRIFPGGDAGALAGSLRETLTEIQKTRDYVTQGFAMIREHHGVDTMLDQLDSLYKRLLDGKGT